MMRPITSAVCAISFSLVAVQAGAEHSPILPQPQQTHYGTGCRSKVWAFARRATPNLKINTLPRRWPRASHMMQSALLLFPKTNPG
ncbi:MAG TPA: hypothetical protein VG206_20615 [Terriglobia bacterium]|nr:hypothetical protein [Terriglobia bacterium]